MEKKNDMRGGAGRKDDVRGSGIYPASAGNAPRDAEVRGQQEFVKHKGARSKKAKGYKRAI